jgi:predicted dehydrogenase
MSYAQRGSFIMEKTGVGIIGTGRRGYDLGLCIIDLIDSTSLEIRALNNRTRIRMEEAREAFLSKYAEHGLAPEIKLCDSYVDLVQDPEVKLIIIVSPQNVHREHAVAALGTGKKVFLDKPMAHRLDEAVVIRQREVETDNPLFIGFTRRYEQTWLKTFTLVEEGVIGDPRMILVKDVLPYHIYFHDWHRRMGWSGGVVADKISHLFDACNWPPRRCSECNRDCPYRVVTVHDESRPDMRSRCHQSGL